MRVVRTAAWTTMQANPWVRSIPTYPVQQPLNYLRGAISCPLPSIARSSSKEPRSGFWMMMHVLKCCKRGVLPTGTPPYRTCKNTVIHTHHKPQ